MKKSVIHYSISKIILILTILGILIVILISQDSFFDLISNKKLDGPRINEQIILQKKRNLFDQVIRISLKDIENIWLAADDVFSDLTNKDEMNLKNLFQCPEEVRHTPSIGKNYYRCNPHFWQCYWQGGMKKNPSLTLQLMGTTYHVYAKPSFPSNKIYSSQKRFYELRNKGIHVNIGVKEIPEFSQSLFLGDTCRDVLLPQRTYSYQKENKEIFLWDNIGKNIFIDRYYVTNRLINDWKVLRGRRDIETDRKEWPKPALLKIQDQKKYCQFFGKKLLNVLLFEAAAFSLPQDNSSILYHYRPQTPWNREIDKTFLGQARREENFLLSSKHCGLALVKECPQKFYTSDSASWMGVNHILGYYPESLINFLEPKRNLKMSSYLFPASSEWHEIGKYSYWNGKQNPELPVAFRCYEEVL